MNFIRNHTHQALNFFKKIKFNSSNIQQSNIYSNKQSPFTSIYFNKETETVSINTKNTNNSKEQQINTNTPPSYNSIIAKDNNDLPSYEEILKTIRKPKIATTEVYNPQVLQKITIKDLIIIEKKETLETLISNNLNDEQINLIIHQIKQLLNINLENKITKHQILDVLLPIMTNNLKIINIIEYKKIKNYLLTLLEKLEHHNQLIKYTKTSTYKIERLINIYIKSITTPKSIELIELLDKEEINWILDDRKKLLNEDGICVVNSYNDIAYKTLKVSGIESKAKELQEKIILPVNISEEELGKRKFLAKETKNSYTEAIIQSKFIYNQQGFHHTQSIISTKEQFAKTLLAIIETSNMSETNNLLPIELITPAVKNGGYGHSMSLNIKFKKIAQQSYYSISFYDSNFRKGNEDYSFTRDIWLTKSELKKLTIKSPLYNYYGNHIVFKVIEKKISNQIILIKDNELTLEEIKKNPFILEYCNINKKEEYLSYLLSLDNYNEIEEALNRKWGNESLSNIILSNATVELRNTMEKINQKLESNLYKF